MYEGVDLEVVEEHRVDLVLDVAQHAGGTAPGRQVKSKRSRPGRVQRAGLGRGRCPRALRKPACTRWVAGVRAGDRAPPGGVDLGGPAPSRRSRRRDRAPVHRRPATGDCTSCDLDGDAVAQQIAVVGVLAAALGVERGAVEHDLDLRRPARAAGTGAPSTSSPTTRGLGAQLGVAEELRCGRRRRARCGTSVASPWPTLRVAASALARCRCSLHERAEAVLVDRQPGLGGHLQGQVDREAVGVVQLEGLVAGQHASRRRFESGHRRLEDPRAGRRASARKASSSAATTVRSARSRSISSG